MELSYVGRRVLAHLPVWAEDEAAFIELEGGPELSIRSYTLPAFTARLDEDQASPPMTQEQVGQCLAELASQGLCEDAEGWRMTQAGYEALIAPVQEESREAGPAFIELNPANQQSIGQGA